MDRLWAEPQSLTLQEIENCLEEIGDDQPPICKQLLTECLRRLREIHRSWHLE